MFTANGYPEDFFYRIVNTFLNSKMNPKTNSQKQDENKIIIKIPFIGKSSLILKKSLSKIFKKLNANVDIVYSSYKVKNYLSLKCVTPRFMKSNAVYKFTCSRDASRFYIGKTKRHLTTRIEEHKKTKSAVNKHVAECEACQQSGIMVKNFEIIGTGRSDFEVTVKEALLIKKLNPAFNRLLFQKGASHLLDFF